MKISNLEQYQKYVSRRLADFLPVLQKAAVGDFSSSIPIPNEEDEFIELSVAINLLMADLKEFVSMEKNEQDKKINEAIAEANRARLRFLEDSQQATLNMMEDLNEEKQKAASFASEWQETFDAMMDGVSIHSPNHEILNVNQALCRLLGKKKEALIGQKCYVVFHGTNCPLDGCPLEKAIISKQPEYAEVFEPKYNAWLAVSTVPILGPDQAIEKLVHVVRNITDRKKAEDALLSQNHELERLYKVKTEFTSMVSHELRTPLTAIKEGLAIVLDGTTGKVNDDQKHFLDLASRNVDRLARLINDVLDFAKLDAGKMKIDIKPNNLVRLINDVVNSQLAVAEKKGLCLKADITYAEFIAPFDLDRISQVLINLINNALKFTEKGGIAVRLSHEHGAGFVEVSVSDTGPGIAKENLSSLFQEFTQLGGPENRKTGGTGLGLAICKKIIEQHRGKIWAESELGKGASIVFSLPLSA